MERACSK